MIPTLLTLSMIGLTIAFRTDEISTAPFFHNHESGIEAGGPFSRIQIVHICLVSSAALLALTFWRQGVLLHQYPAVKDKRKRFHAGVLSLFFSPTAGHVWFSLVFPWFAFVLADQYFFPGEVMIAPTVNPIPWTIYALLLLMISLPFLSLEQLKRELIALQESHRVEQNRQVIQKQVAALRHRINSVSQ